MDLTPPPFRPSRRHTVTAQHTQLGAAAGPAHGDLKNVSRIEQCDLSLKRPLITQVHVTYITCCSLAQNELSVRILRIPLNCTTALATLEGISLIGSHPSLAAT